MKKKYSFYIIMEHDVDGHLVWFRIDAPTKQEALEKWKEQGDFHDAYFTDKNDPTYFEFPREVPIYLVYQEGDEPYVDPDGEEVTTFSSLEEFEEKTGAACV